MYLFSVSYFHAIQVKQSEGFTIPSGHVPGWVKIRGIFKHPLSIAKQDSISPIFDRFILLDIPEVRDLKITIILSLDDKLVLIMMAKINLAFGTFKIHFVCIFCFF